MNVLKEYINSGFIPSDTFMYVIQNGIRYIYEASAVNTLDKRTHRASLIGIYATGHFYAMSEKYLRAGLDYISELMEFENRYNTKFDEQMKCYSAQNPIGGDVSPTVNIRLDRFREQEMEKVALDLIYGNIDLKEKPIDHSYFEPLFLRYLLLGNKSLDGAVRADINEHADELNFVLISEDMAYKRVAELLRDERTIERIALYGMIKRSENKEFSASIRSKGAVTDNIDINKEQLLRMIKYDEAFTYKERLIVRFDDITTIKNDGQILYKLA